MSALCSRSSLRRGAGSSLMWTSGSRGTKVTAMAPAVPGFPGGSKAASRSKCCGPAALAANRSRSCRLNMPSILADHPSGYDDPVILEWQSRLADAVRSALRTALDVAPETVTFQYPPRVEMGDLALTTPFDLAKTLRRKPREIAERLAAGLTAPGIRHAELACVCHVSTLFYPELAGR